MSKSREQLNTDIMLNTLSAMHINNLLLLQIAKLSRSETASVQEAIDQIISKSNGLSDQSKVLDSEENG